MCVCVCVCVCARVRACVCVCVCVQVAVETYTLTLSAQHGPFDGFLPPGERERERDGEYGQRRRENTRDK